MKRDRCELSNAERPSLERRGDRCSNKVWAQSSITGSRVCKACQRAVDKANRFRRVPGPVWIPIGSPVLGSGVIL